MSQSNAETSELGVGGIKKVDGAMEIEVQNGSEVKGPIDDNLETCSEIVEEDADVAADGDKGADKSDAPKEILNEYVINEISKYLKFQDLESLRRVNKLWSAGATPQFFQNAVISLNAGGTSEETLKAIAEKASNIKRLKALKMEFLFFGSKKEVELIQDIFAKLAPTLQGLKLNYRIDEDFSIIRGAPINLPALTTITLDKNCNFKLETWRLLYTVAPALRQLVVQNFRPSFLSPLLSEDGNRNRSLAPKLSSFSMRFFNFPEDDSLDFLFLVNFPQLWESLDIALYSFTEDDFEALFQLLEKNKDSLVTLKLDISDIRVPHYQPPQPYALRLPATFSKLKKLKLDFYDLHLHDDVTFGGRGLIYSEAFPSLSSLSVRLPWSSGTAGDIFRSLFPPQVFQGLKHFKVDMVNLRLDEFPPDQEIPGDWAQNMFPNAKIKIS